MRAKKPRSVAVHEMRGFLRAIRRDHPHHVHTLWYVFSLTFCSVSLLFFYIYKNARTIGATPLGDEHIRENIAVFFMNSSTEVREEVYILAAIGSLLIVPQILSYFEPLAKFIERGEFSLCSRGRSGRRSGRRGPELRDAEYLIDRECHHAEHEVAFDLDRAAHAHGPCAEFILQSGVDAFGQGAKIKNDVVRIGHMDEFHALDFFGPFGLGFVLGAKVAIDDRRMAERLAVVMDGGG